MGSLLGKHSVLEVYGGARPRTQDKAGRHSEKCNPGQGESIESRYFRNATVAIVACAQLESSGYYKGD